MKPIHKALSVAFIAAVLAAGCKPPDNNSNQSAAVTPPPDQVRTQATATVITPPADTSQSDVLPPPASTADRARDTAQAVQKETREAADAIKEYAYAEKAEFTEKMRQEAETLASETDKLKTRIEAADATIKDEAQPRLMALKEKAAQLNTKINDVKDATETHWDDVKAGVRDGYEDLKESLKQAKQWLSDKLGT